MKLYQVLALACIAIVASYFISAQPFDKGSFDSVVLIQFSPPADGRDHSSLRSECKVSCTIGSGVTLPGGYIATAAHVIEGGNWKVGDVLTILDFQGLPHEAKVLQIDHKTDTAILKYTNWKSGPTSPLLCNASYQVGDEVIVRGGPLFLGLLTTHGRIIRLPHAFSGIAGADGFVLVDAALNSGNSGGPVYDVYGRVIGLADALVLTDYATDSGFRLVVPASDVCALLTKAQTVV